MPANERTLRGADCDGDRRDDAEEIAADPSLDCNHNGRLDTCDVRATLAFAGPEFFDADLLDGVSLTPADVDGDGAPDVVLSSRGVADLAILWNDRRGGFSAPTFIGIGAAIAGAAVADLDRDGDADLAVASEPPLVVRRIGRRSFVLGQRLVANSALGPLAAGDLDLDGDVDLIAARIGERRLAVFWNRGAAVFNEAEDLLPGLVAERVSVGDFDRDGWQDLLLGSAEAVTVAWGLGGGAFTPVTTPAPGQGAMHAAVADLDGDGLSDLVVAQEGTPPGAGGLWRIRGAAGRTFQPALPLGAFGELLPRGLVAADLERDGDVDLVLKTAAGTFSILANLGNGGFAAALEYHHGPGEGLAAADLDGDGLPELLNGALQVLRNRGQGTFAGTTVVATPGGADGAAAADFDGDLDLDILVAQGGSGRVLALRNDGQRRFGASGSWAVGADPRALIAVDLDGDGRVDAISANAGSGDLSLLWNDGLGGFSAGARLASGNSPLALASGDFDRDGRPDLAAANLLSRDVAVWRNLGQRAFAAALRTAIGAELRSIASADLDGDGDLDLVAAAEGAGTAAAPGTIAILRNDGAGQFASPQTFAAAAEAPRQLVAADLDSDGDVDLACAGLSVDLVSIFANRGNGTFQPSQRHAAVDPAALAFFDLEGDGDRDLGVASGSILLQALLADGRGSFERRTWAANPFTVAGAGAADLDGDGDADLFGWGAQSAVRILWNESAPPLSHDANGTGVPDECEGCGVACRRLFHRGDPDLSGAAGIADAITVLSHVFLGDPAVLPCRESADLDNSARLDLLDGILFLTWLYVGGVEPAPPGGPRAACGSDPDPLGSAGDLGCASYPVCD